MNDLIAFATDALGPVIIHRDAILEVRQTNTPYGPGVSIKLKSGGTFWTTTFDMSGLCYALGLNYPDPY